jgi:hypothetical protein
MSPADKSGGEFYTPQGVSELLTDIAVVNKTEVNKVSDLASGSGLLLLKFAKVLGQDKVRQGLSSNKPNDNSSPVNCPKESSSALVVTRGYGSVLLEARKEILDQMARLMQIFVVLALHPACADAGYDYRFA